MFIFFLIILLLMPFIMIGFGLLWKLNPPKKINDLYGYRTSWSKKSQKTWDFAHGYFGKAWLYTGVPLGIITILLLAAFRNYNVDDLGLIVIIITLFQLIVMCIPIAPTEIALRKKFDKNGNEK